MIPSFWQYRAVGLLLQTQPAGPLSNVPGMRSGAYRWNVLIALVYLFLSAIFLAVLRAIFA